MRVLDGSTPSWLDQGQGGTLATLVAIAHGSREPVITEALLHERIMVRLLRVILVAFPTILLKNLPFHEPAMS